ncbi:DUF2993 domain-containing protein [Microbacterium sp. ACRRU]|jgi:hypothetical protein|uniref:DUF2993 domain-containing protein n=1 Tax=Microbacterium sp. ACRRU TaxID=2918204 RepID=UPI001EF56328|nr:DUF2993 domain-containing protein [Microbacterium sp. ACRRU]MCG7416605.1 DUF2993 domain-containing protein [Microbacterium sp. ACRRU]
MTLFDESTAVLTRPAPSPEAADSPPSSFPTARVVLLIVILLGLAVAAVLVGEAVGRSEVERSVAAEARAAMSLPESQHIGAVVDGSALLQGVVNHYESIHLTMPNAPFAEGTADLAMTLTGAHLDDGGVWVADRVAVVASLNAGQATSMYIPENARGAMQIGFRGADMALDVSMASGGTNVAASVAVTPAFADGWLSATVSSVTMGGTTLSGDELRVKLGDDALGALQAPPVCLAEALPRSMTVREVEVRDQHLRIDAWVDVALWNTPAGAEPGACGQVSP